MIRVNFNKSGKLITGFECKGHSMSAPSGQDIVCAAVSSACLMTANTVTEVLKLDADAAATEDQGEIDWQAQALTAKIFRADNATHDWCWIGDDFDTEAGALAAMKTKLGVQ